MAPPYQPAELTAEQATMLRDFTEWMNEQKANVLEEAEDEETGETVKNAADALGFSAGAVKKEFKKQKKKRKDSKFEVDKNADGSQALKPVWHPLVPVGNAAALKFLRGTKWRVGKAKEKYRALCVLCADHLSNVPIDDCIRFIESGAVAIPAGARDREGRQLIFITPKFLVPIQELDEAPWVRAATNYRMYEAFSDAQTQVEGFAGILDLGGAKMTRNIEAQKQGSVLSEAYPCRVGSFMIVDAPWWGRLLFNLFKRFINAKMIRRVDFLTRAELYERADLGNLLPTLGGSFEYNAMAAAAKVREFYAFTDKEQE